MILGEFGSDETGHGRFAFEAEQTPDGFEYGLLELSKWAWTLLLYNSSDFIFSELYCKNSVTSEDQVGPWNLAQHTLRLFLFITSTRNVYQPFHLFSDTF